MLVYRNGPESDPFYDLYNSPGWLTDYDPPRDFPFWLNIEPTNRCQLDCLFCSRQKSKRPLGNMSLETLDLIVNEAARYQETGLRMTGWGEPLLHPQIADMVRTIKKAGLKLKIYTNGLALTPELMNDFIDCQVDDLQFSMQGLNAEQYEFNRRGSSYERLYQNIKMASHLRSVRSRPFLSILTSTLADEAQQACPEVFCRDMLALVDKVAVDLTNLNFVADQQRIKAHLNRQSGQLLRKPCVDIFLALEIKYDGLIQFCGQDSEGLTEHSLGNINDGLSLHQAWHSAKMNAHRQLVGRGLGHDSMTVCRNCYHNTSKYDLFKK